MNATSPARRVCCGHHRQPSVMRTVLIGAAVLAGVWLMALGIAVLLVRFG